MKHATRAIFYLAAACVMMCMASTVHAQIPEPGRPKVVGVFCPDCKELIKTPNGKSPISCPHCGFSFIKTDTQPFSSQRKTGKPQLQNIDPFGDYLFFGVPINPEDGKLQTRHLDPNGIAARAEEWGKQMKEVDEQNRKKQEAQAQEFERKKQATVGASQPAGIQLKNPYAEDGKKAPTPQLLRNPYSSGDAEAASGAPIGGELTEHAQIRSFSDHAKYASMGPGELDALAARYPDNPEIQKAVTALKAKVKSMESLAATSERTRLGEETMISEQQKGNREAARSAATILDLTANVPQGLDEVYYGEKTMAQYLGVDVASSQIQDGVKDFAVGQGEKFASGKGWATPGSVKSLGGLGSAVDGLTSIEDLVSLAKSANAAGDHYVNAAELRAQLQASGGTVSAVGNWSYVRNQALADSAKLDQLIREEEARK